MTTEPADRTSASLLGRLRQDAADQLAWGEFVRRYGPLVYGWSRKWGLQEADAQDVTQTVLVKLAEKLRTFDYDAGRSFRAYLKTLTRYAWCDLLEARKRPGAGSGDSAVAQCWDNAPVESFFASLKKELVHHEKYTTRAEARASIFEYVEAFYNRVRRHSSLGFLSPREFEQTHNPDHP